jgi:hypothetical protein
MMAKLTSTQTDIALTVPADTFYSKELGAWIAGDQRFSDDTGGEYNFTPDAEVALPPTLGAIAFQRLFTRAERVKSRELRATDANLDDIWRQIEDPRTDVVVMALPSVQEDIEYTLQAVHDAGLDIDIAARKAQILAGQIR